MEKEVKTSDVLFKRLLYAIVFFVAIGFGLMMYNNSNVISKESQLTKIAEESFENGVVRQYSKESDDRLNFLTVINHEEELVAGMKRIVTELQSKDIQMDKDIVIISGKYTDETKDNLPLSIRLSMVNKYSLDFNNYDELLDMLNSAHN